MDHRALSAVQVHLNGLQLGVQAVDLRLHRRFAQLHRIGLMGQQRVLALQGRALGLQGFHFRLQRGNTRPGIALAHARRLDLLLGEVDFPLQAQPQRFPLGALFLEPLAQFARLPLGRFALLVQFLGLARNGRTQRSFSLVQFIEFVGRGFQLAFKCSYVNREVTSAVTRLDHSLSEQGTAQDQKITIVSHGAGEFEKAFNGSYRPLLRILDWFHITMKFRAIEQSAQKLPDLAASNGRSVQDDIASAKWLMWHGRGFEAVERLKRLHDMIGLAPEDAVCRALWWDRRGTYWYPESNAQYLVNYGWRYPRGMPISSIAESAVNEVVSLRCAKNRQMRWTNKGAHLLV